MRIALNAMQVRAAKSGVGQYIAGLLPALAEACSADLLRVYCTAENVKNYRFPAANLEAVVWGLPESRRTMRLLNEYVRLHAELRRERFDLFHGLSNFLPPVKVCPYVVTIHDLSYFVHPHRCPWLRRHYWYAMTRRTVAVADAIITDSEHSRRDIEHFFPQVRGQIRVVYPAAHPRFSPTEQDSDARDREALGIRRPYLLYVGTLEPGKNVERIIQAFDRLASRHPEHELLLAGDRGWLFEGIFEAARRATARDRIRFLGHVADEIVPALMRGCDLFVFPSLYEGFGLPPLEAMACGAPVVTSTASSIPEVVGDAALQIDPLSTDELASAMHRVLAEPSLRADLRARGPERARQFSWQRAAAETRSVYLSVASRGQAS
ncbi:MAG: glycosyltransferase family 4 protein [Candidatus Sumerlaeaceae bacterium]|nr:glycosyltransferase family 4 protein [Candidatus Sumerlaeaceae bacterium]